VTVEIDTETSAPCSSHHKECSLLCAKNWLSSYMQQNRVIQPSFSPQSSPVVMVHKRDESHYLCVDYRALNAVTKDDTFPLPHVDDLLD